MTSSWEEGEEERPASIPSLQFLSLNTLLCLLHKGEEEEEGDCPLPLLLHLLQTIFLPPSLLQHTLLQLARKGLLTSSILSSLVSQGVTTLTFIGVDFSLLGDDLFDELLEGGNSSSSSSSVTRLVLNGVEMSPCLYKMFIRSSFNDTVSCPLHTLSHLHMNNCDSLTDDFLVLFSKSFPHLQSLFISNCPSLTAETVMHLTHSSLSTTLTALDISYNWASSESMSFLSNLVEIRELDISCVKGAGTFIFTISSPHLRSLRMSGMSSLEGEDVVSILSAPKILKNLTEFSLTESLVTSDGLRSILHKYSTSPLSYSSSLACDAFLGLIKLNLSWCEDLDDQLITEVVSRCPHLEELILKSTSAGLSTFNQVISSCPHLRKLDIGRCAQENLPLRSLTSLKHLRHLNIAWALFAPEELDGFLDDLREGEAAELRELTLQGCQGVSEYFIMSIMNDPTTLCNLSFLDLGWVHLFSSSTVAELSAKRPSIEIRDYYMEVHKGGERLTGGF